MEDSKVREIVDGHIRQLKWALCLNDWHLTVCYGKLDALVDGRCTADYRYKHATITLDPAELETEDRILYVLLHEMLHVALAPFDMVSDLARRFAGTDEGKAAIDECTTNAGELAVDALERALEIGMGLTPKKIAAIGEKRTLVAKPQPRAKKKAKKKAKRRR